MFERCYDFPVTSKKGVIGIGVLNDSGTKSQPRTGMRLFCSCPFLAARWEGRKTRRFSSAVADTPILSSRRPQLALGALVIQPTDRSTSMTRRTLASFIALPEDTHNKILQAREALHALACMATEIGEKAMGHHSKDGYLHVPAVDMGSLLLCIHDSMDTVGAQSVPALVKLFAKQTGEHA